MVMEKKKKGTFHCSQKKVSLGKNESERISVLLCMTLYCISCTEGWTVGSSWLDRPEIKVFHVLEVPCAIAPSAKQKSNVIKCSFYILHQTI